MQKLAVLALAVAAAVLAGGASAAPQQKTIRLVLVQQHMYSNPAVGPSSPPRPGMTMIFDQALYNAAPQFGKPKGALVGRASSICTIVSAQDLQCAVAAHLPDGQLALMGSGLLRSPNSTLAIAGGAGAYTDARGSASAHSTSQTRSLVTVRFA